MHSRHGGAIRYKYELYDSNAVALGVCRIGDPMNFGHGVESATKSAFKGMVDEFALFDRALSE